MFLGELGRHLLDFRTIKPCKKRGNENGIDFDKIVMIHTTFTMDHDTLMMVNILMSLGKERISKSKSKKLHKILIKEKRSQGLKAWHQMNRIVKEREATKRRNRSNAMKAAWIKRKSEEIK
jgi:hypothetical protein